MDFSERRALVEERRQAYNGKRVRFIQHGEPDPCPLEPGDEGDVLNVDDIGTLCVRWKSGRVLGVIIEDQVEIIGDSPE